MTDKTLGSKRLEYIDAMRGLTMLLVVYSHISVLGFDVQNISILDSINEFFCQFRMPLFFFVSGFVLYKIDQTWDLKSSLLFLAKKFKVQILSTLFFLGLFSYIFDLSFVESLTDLSKRGYWFTITLFDFFVLYLIFNKLIEKHKGSWVYDALLFTIGFAINAITSRGSNTLVSNCLGIFFLKYFIFFAVGIIAKRNWDKLKDLFDNSVFTAICIFIFFVLSIIDLKEHFFYGVDIIIAIAGIFTIFAFFYKHQDSFTTETKVGRVLQYIGKRTLDIYLLHYFFLPQNLNVFGEWFTKNINPTLELFVSLALAAMVISLCLVVSNIIRLSPLLANWLFGVKK